MERVPASRAEPLMVLADPRGRLLTARCNICWQYLGPGSRSIHAALGSSSRETDFCRAQKQKSIFLCSFETGGGASASFPLCGDLDEIP